MNPNEFTNATNQAVAKILVLCLVCAAAALGQNKSDELKQHVLAQAKSLSADDYAFTRTIRGEQTFGGKTEKKVTVEKFDPSKSVDVRWTLVSVNGAPPSAEDLKAFQKETAKRRVPGYYRLANYFGSPATTSTDSSGRTVFHFTNLPKATVIVMDSDASASTIADAIVSETNGVPFVEQLHLSVKPMRLKLVMKIEHYESTTRYRIGPDGKPILVEQIADMTGSGLGKEGTGHTVTTYSDYRLASR